MKVIAEHRIQKKSKQKAYNSSQHIYLTIYKKNNEQKIY